MTGPKARRQIAVMEIPLDLVPMIVHVLEALGRLRGKAGAGSNDVLWGAYLDLERRVRYIEETAVGVDTDNSAGLETTALIYNIKEECNSCGALTPYHAPVCSGCGNEREKTMPPGWAE